MDEQDRKAIRRLRQNSFKTDATGIPSKGCPKHDHRASKGALKSSIGETFFKTRALKNRATERAPDVLPCATFMGTPKMIAGTCGTSATSA